jgi:hypothetical protein
MVELARIRAIQQRDKEALDLISAAIARGWLPDGLEVALDLPTSRPSATSAAIPGSRRHGGRSSLTSLASGRSWGQLKL